MSIIYGCYLGQAKGLISARNSDNASEIQSVAMYFCAQMQTYARISHKDQWFSFVCVFVCVKQAAAGNIINMLWQLMENGLEELKLLQTVLVLLTTNTVVHDEVLSKVKA